MSDKARVLVVDDLQDAANMLASLVRLAGHEAMIAMDGHSAIAACAGFRPNVVLLDLALPGLDGYEVCRRIRALPESEAMLIVVVSGHGQTDDKNRSIAAGANYHFLKPVDPQKLLGLITLRVNRIT
jgi:CheY-like chemotaxis protein